MTATVAFVNQKGGVGKTSVTLGIASAAWAAGRRTLVVDLDPQASATWVLGIDPTEVESSTAEVLHNPRSGGAAKAIVASAWGEEIDVLPSSSHLLDKDGSARSAGRLRTALEGIDDYDLILVDCPPSLGNLTTNALAAATHAVVVAEPSSLGLRGIEAVADTIDSIWQEHNDALDLAGVILNRVPAISAEADRQYDEIVRVVGRKAVWQPVVPQRVVVSVAISERRPIHSYGYRAHDVVDAFDQLYAKLRRTARK
jgi:chromosome partitioning protein